MPPVLEKQEAVVAARDRPPSFGRRLAVSILRFSLIVALSALIGGGYYLARKGFGRQWRSRVVEELHRRGVEASMRRLTLDPFRGLIARDVRIFDYKNRENLLAVVSEISLDINYAAFLHRQPFLNALDVRNAQIILPLKSPDGKIGTAELNNFRAHVYFPPEQIYVSQAEGIFCGVRISATGQLIKRADYKPSPESSAEEWEKMMSILERLVDELQKLKFPTTAPSLQVKFSGDLADLENARVEATLRADRIERGGYAIRNLSAGAEWADQTFNLTHCEWSDTQGNFAGQAKWSRQTNAADFQIRSNLDLKGLSEAFEITGLLKETEFKASPLVEASGSANFAEEHPQLKIIGHAAVGGFVYKSVPFSDLSLNFSWDGERALLRDIHLRHQSGQLTAEVFDSPNEFRLNIDSTINPGALRPLTSGDMSQFMGEWEWQRPPTVHLEIRGPDRNPSNWRGQGTLALNRTRFRGSWANSGTARIVFGDGAVTYENLRVTRDEGIGTGTFTYDFKNHEVRISNVKTSLRPAEVIFWIDPKIWNTVAPYKFRQPPNLTINGVYQFRGGKKTQLQVIVDAPHGMDYDFLGKTLPFDRVTGRLLFTDEKLQLVDVKAGLFGGNVRGNADISLAHDDPRYRAKIAASSIDFPSLTDLYYQYKTSHGELDGSYDFTGLGSNARIMQGTGKIQVTNGDVFAIPIFGPLSGILNTIVPGTGYTIGRKATASLRIKDGIIHSDDLEVAGKIFSMLGHGDIHFLDDKLDFEVRMDMHGAAGLLLTPVYKLFEYVGEGSLKKPDWHPKRF
ncbi:MAG: AsmA-like C-terminal region-containing protein [Verrucomicrobiota bacterium]